MRRLEYTRYIYIISLQYSIVYYEKDGDEVFQHRLQPDVVTLPDYEILQVNMKYQKSKYDLLEKRTIHTSFSTDIELTLKITFHKIKEHLILLSGKSRGSETSQTGS